MSYSESYLLESLYEITRPGTFLVTQGPNDVLLANMTQTIVRSRRGIFAIITLRQYMILRSKLRYKLENYEESYLRLGSKKAAENDDAVGGKFFWVLQAGKQTSREIDFAVKLAMVNK